MNEHKPLHKVIVDAKGVALVTIKRRSAEYRKASKRAILRQRDAIELFTKLKKAGKGFNGVHVFHFLETARTFAILCLHAKLREIQDNLDRVLTYEERSKQRDRKK